MAQPKEWQDCSEALDRDDLKGVVMPKGGLEQARPPGAWLQYNEVSYRNCGIKKSVRLTTHL
jgi:hypothetical protein